MKTRHVLPLLFPGFLAMACGAQVDDNGTAVVRSGSLDAVAASKMDAMLRVLVERQADIGVNKRMPGGIVPTREVTKGGVKRTEVDVLLQADPSALPQIRAVGADVRTVTDSGIMTASIELAKVAALAALPEVSRVEGAKRKHTTNNIAQGLTTAANGNTVGLNNPHATGGAGVVVGVIDTGIDWTHEDFMKKAPGAAEGAPDTVTRVKYYWDQSDVADDAPPSDLGLSYGHQYSEANINSALADYNNTWDPETNAFGPLAAGYPIKASARDSDGHGSHVAGSAAGDGSGSGYAGGAPEADLVIVKFDFDGARNTDAAIIDGIRYIFERAKALGKPAVINLSLGSDYGPHDGTTLEERGLDDLAGPGKMVMVAAGNPGNNDWSPNLSWGYPLHGQAAMGTESISVRVPTYPAAGSDGTYVFFDAWYAAGNKCRVKVTTPSGTTYPPSGGRNSNTWVTGSAYSGMNTADGGILVGNGGDQLGWGDNNADHEAYIEISDYYGKQPKPGTWTVQLVPASSGDKCQGTVQAWYGASNNVVKGWSNEPGPRIPALLFGGRASDNKMTIGSPATANEAIAVAAYQSRNEWLYSQGAECLPTSTMTQAYSVGVLSYYDPYALGELAYFSGRGPRRDSIATPKPEIASPGVGIASSFSHFVRQAEWNQRCTGYSAGGYYHYGTNRVLPGDEAAILQGTSMATPTATGAVALLLDKKKDMSAACLRKLLSTTARHDAATDTYANAPGGALTDTDTAAGTGKPNSDWGYGKLDIANTSAAIASLPSCASACKVDADCGAGSLCQASADPCGCSTCVAVPPPTCANNGQSCSGSMPCCSGAGTCSGKTGKKTCK